MLNFIDSQSGFSLLVKYPIPKLGNSKTFQAFQKGVHKGVLPEPVVRRTLKQLGAYQKGGHFQLTSGQHSDEYWQCAAALQYPWFGLLSSYFLVRKLPANLIRKVDFVVAPAVGGITFADFLSAVSGIRSIYAEKSEDGFVIRSERGFDVGRKIGIVAEDATTSGTSIQKVIRSVESAGGRVSAAVCIVDRSNGEASETVSVRFFPLLTAASHVYSPDSQSCPGCKEKLPAVKLGSSR